MKTSLDEGLRKKSLLPLSQKSLAPKSNLGNASFWLQPKVFRYSEGMTTVRARVRARVRVRVRARVGARVRARVRARCGCILATQIHVQELMLNKPCQKMREPKIESITNELL